MKRKNGKAKLLSIEQILTPKKLVSFFDFGVKNFRYIIIFTLGITLVSVSLSPYTISVDGFAYLKSAEVLFTQDFPTFYHWIREPGYPLFIRVTMDFAGLLFTFYTQGFLIALGILTTILGTYRILKINAVTWKTYLAAGIALALLAGYASTLLQQSLFVAFLGFLIWIISRILDKSKLDKVSVISIFFLIGLSTLTAVFIGLAISLSLLGGLIFSGIRQLRTLGATILLIAISFGSVMVPWSQIKAAQAPPGAEESLAIGAGAAESLLQNFNPVNEGYQLISVFAALLNLGGELPPGSGLGIANENSIFGTPSYSPDHNCGRFLHAGPAGALWGEITTIYQDRCVPQSTLSVISKINGVSQFFFPLVGLAILFSLVLSIRLAPKLRSLVVPAVLVISPYLLLDLAISRYGALLIPLGSVLLTHVVFGKPSSVITSWAPSGVKHTNKNAES